LWEGIARFASIAKLSIANGDRASRQAPAVH